VYQAQPPLVKFPAVGRGIGHVSSTPGVGEGVELRLTYLSARFAKQNVLSGVRVKQRIERDQINARVGEFLPIGKPFQLSPK
jgi:hypothetical protein